MRSFGDLVASRTGVLGVLAPMLVAMVGLLLLPASALVEAAFLGAGLAPLASVVAWLSLRRRRRDANALGPQIDRLETRLMALRADLAATERRIAGASHDLLVAWSPRSVRAAQRELVQDRRLAAAQRRMYLELKAKIERLRIARIRAEMAYAEACRDARLEMPELSADLAARIVSLDRSLDGSEQESEAWSALLEDLRLLHRDLTRGVPRLLAASRLDPLSHAGLADEPHEDDLEGSVVASDGSLDGETDHQLERISRGLEAIDELERPEEDFVAAPRVELRVEAVDVEGPQDEAERDGEGGQAEAAEEEPEPIVLASTSLEQGVL